MAVTALGNVTVSYDANQIESYMNTFSLNAVISAIDTTNFGSSAQEQTPGSGQWTIPVGGQWAKALDDILGPEAASPPSTKKTVVVVIGESGSQATYTWTSSATVGGFVGDYNPAATDVNGVLEWSATLTLSGAPVRT